MTSDSDRVLPVAIHGFFGLLMMIMIVSSSSSSSRSSSSSSSSSSSNSRSSSSSRSSSRSSSSSSSGSSSRSSSSRSSSSSSSSNCNSNEVVPLNTFNNTKTWSMGTNEEQPLLVFEGRPVLLILFRALVLKIDVDDVVDVEAVGWGGIVEEDLGIAHLDFW